MSFSTSKLCALKADRNLRCGWPLPPADSIKKRKKQKKEVTTAGEGPTFSICVATRSEIAILKYIFRVFYLIIIDFSNRATRNITGAKWELELRATNECETVQCE